MNIHQAERVLGVSRDAGAHEIRQAFRRKAKLLHPGTCSPSQDGLGNSDRTVAFMQLLSAYDLLRQDAGAPKHSPNGINRHTHRVRPQLRGRYFCKRCFFSTDYSSTCPSCELQLCDSQICSFDEMREKASRETHFKAHNQPELFAASPMLLPVLIGLLGSFHAAYGSIVLAAIAGTIATVSGAMFLWWRVRPGS